MSTMQTGSFKLKSNKPSETTNNDFSTFKTITFPTPFPTGSNVVVIPMTQTFKGNQTVGLRIGKVNRTSFKIRINELVTNKGAISDGAHNQETIGWIAFSTTNT